MMKDMIVNKLLVSEASFINILFFLVTGDGDDVFEDDELMPKIELILFILPVIFNVGLMICFETLIVGGLVK